MFLHVALNSAFEEHKKWRTKIYFRVRNQTFIIISELKWQKENIIAIMLGKAWKTYP